MKNKFKWSLLAAVALLATVAMAADKYISSSGNVVIKTATSKSVNLQDTLYTTQAGNVGVGTSTPAGKFDVNGKLTVLSSGNVGVGTIIPVAPFHIALNSTGAATGVIDNVSDLNSKFTLQEMAGGAIDSKQGLLFSWASSSGVPIVSTGIVASRRGVGWGTGLSFHTQNAVVSGELLERMVITDEGRVGIGTTTPAGSLEISTPSGLANLYLTHASAGRAWLSIRNGTTSWGGFGQVGAWKGDGNTDLAISAEGGGGIQFFTNGLGTPKMTIASGGTVYMSSLSGGGTVTSSAGNLSVSSDASLKVEHKIPLPGMKELLELRPVAYQWKTGIKLGKKKAPVEFGFMANEVAKIIPEAAPKGPNGLYGLHDRAIIVAAVNAIKEQQKVIELQKAWICAQANAPEELCKGN